MAKADVPEYYGYAADKIDGVIQLIHDGAKEGGDAFRSTYAIAQCMNTHEFAGTLDYLAAVDGLPDGDSFNSVVEGLIRRHCIRNQLHGLWSAFEHYLPETSIVRTRMLALLRKAKDVSYAEMYEKYPETRRQ